MSKAVPGLDETAPPPLERIVEAMLFIGGAPLSVPRACEAVRGLTPDVFARAIAALNRTYREQNRPYRIQRRDDGYELALRPAFHPVRDRLYGARREARLSQPALDTLALVAYRQPLTRQEVDSQRGADSLALLRQLVKLGLLAVQRGSSGEQAVSYSTTTRFLKLFGLRDLDDLPRTADPGKM